MKEQPQHPWIEPELEVRIVALVLGEASDFERAELERLIEERLELAILKKRIEAVHGRLSDVATGESAADDDDWKLSAEKRQAVLAVIDGETKEELAKNIFQESVEKRKSAKGKYFWNFSKIAALLCVVGFIANMAMLEFRNHVSTDPTLMRRMASQKANTLSSKDALVPAIGIDSAVPAIGQDSTHATSSNSHALSAVLSAGTERDYEADSKSSLLAIRSSLGRYVAPSTESMTLLESDESEIRDASTDDGRRTMAARLGDLLPQPMSERAAGALISPTRVGEEAAQTSQDDRKGYARNLGIENSLQRGRKAVTSPGRSANQSVPTSPNTIDTVTSQTQKQVMESRRELAESTKFYFNTSADESTGEEFSRGEQIDQNLGRFQSRQNELHRQRRQPATAGRSSTFGQVPHLVGGKSQSGMKLPLKKSAPPAGLNEKTAEKEAFSTFSLHVSDVSFKLAQAALAQGEWPEAAKVRIEEFVNAFDYGDPMPSQSEKVACRLEQTIHPFLQQRNLLRVSMRTAAAGRSGDTPLRLTFLLDNSGSMERVDREETVRRAFALLVQQLKPIDQVTLISFARQPRLLADKVSGAKSRQLIQLIHNLPSEGGTNLEAALQLAFEKARQQQLNHAQNRIIMLTDGAANLGDAEPESLSRIIETMRNAGLAFDAAGISAEGLNDEILEALTRKGDGRYYLLDQPEDADDGFARQIAGALRPAVKNVKVQIEFNPQRVGRYKLLGFEKHRLKKEDFLNDQVDAAEMAAAEAGVAVYQFETKPDGEGDVGSVSVRFRDMSTGQMVENRWPIPYEADAPHLDQAAPSVRIATVAALLAAKLRGEPLGETVDLKTLSNLLAGLPDRHRKAKRIQQLQQMIHQTRQVSGE